MRTRIVAALVVCAALIAATGCDESGRIEHDKKNAVEVGVTDTGPGTIFSLLVDTADLSTLTAAIGSADLVERFESKGPYTLFAPDNKAWAKLGEDRLESLMSTETANLRQGILNHTVKGKLLTQSLKDGQVLKSIGGPKLTIRNKGGVYYVNGAAILRPNKETANGVVHEIDSVIR